MDYVKSLEMGFKSHSLSLENRFKTYIYGITSPMKKFILIAHSIWITIFLVITKIKA